MSKVQKSIKINGMTCVNCALNVERAVKKAGIQNAVVNFSTRELIIEDITGIDETLVEKIITQSGFEVVKVGEAPKSKRLDDIFFYSVIVIAIYFMIQMFFPMHWKNVWVDFILATPALLVGISKFGSGAWHSLKAGSANMYVLILLGAITAYVFSIFLAVRGEHMVYFETTAVIIALVMLGDKLEEKAINKTTSALSSLATMQIQKAKKKIGDFFEEVSLNEVKKGDLVQVNEGDQIPTDGFIIDGSALVNEALLTGESEPIFKEKNALIYSGSIILNGQFTYEVSKPGHESALARINQLVQKASTEKANIQKLADRISAVFVPLIITIAFVWFFVAYYFLHLGFEQSIIRSVAILVISCPCAMGLATPMAVMVAIGKLSENGILIKGAQTIETFAGVKNMLFDKTGTLTTGAFTLTNFKSYAIDENEAKAIILALENKSSHPIALSIQKQFNHLTAFPLENITEIKGKGIQATDMLGNQYKLGSAHFTQLNQIEADIYLTKNDKLIASFNIKDTLKDKVKDTLSYYQSKGVTSLVLSGDSLKKCDMLQQEIGVSVKGQLSPEDKLLQIENYNQSVTAMIGDGINDAPAMSKAHIGISFSNASNIAIESANIVLLNNDFSLLRKAHQIALMTLQTIKQNLFWAFAYNLVAIPLAAFGILNPMWAAFFMLFSDLVVIGNAYRLKLRKID